VARSGRILTSAADPGAPASDALALACVVNSARRRAGPFTGSAGVLPALAWKPTSCREANRRGRGVTTTGSADASTLPRHIQNHCRGHLLSYLARLLWVVVQFFRLVVDRDALSLRELDINVTDGQVRV
jgi:hypothetical protein